MSIKVETRFLHFIGNTSVVKPGTTVSLDGVSPKTEVTFPTPNIAIETTHNKFGDVRTIYEKVMPSFISGPKLIGKILGIQKRYSWERDSDDETEDYTELEKKITDHPLVGKIAAAYLGEQFDGRVEDLLQDPSGEWRIAQVNGREFTVNYRWRRVQVEAGKAAEYFQQNRSNPRLIVKILEEPYEGQMMPINFRNLLVDPSKQLSVGRGGRGVNNEVKDQLAGLDPSGFPEGSFDFNREVEGIQEGIDEAGEIGDLQATFQDVPTDQIAALEERARNIGVDLRGGNFTVDELSSMGIDTEGIIGLGNTGGGLFSPGYGTDNSGEEEQ